VLKKALPALMAILLLTFLALDPLMGYLLAVRDIWQYVWALLVLFPIGFLMGLPFTIGMRDFLTSATQRAYAWSANGCASVITAIVSAQIALIFGISSILGCAIAAYLSKLKWTVTPDIGEKKHRVSSGLNLAKLKSKKCSIAGWIQITAILNYWATTQGSILYAMI
jgi:hypothetical protein